MNTDDSVVVIKRINFTHDFNEHFEYYAHTDQQGWTWQLWRHLQGSEATQRVWHASVDQPGPEGATQMLNNKCCLMDGCERRGPLYPIDLKDHQALLRALAGLVHKGQWPQETLFKPRAPRRKRVPASG